MSYKCTTCGRHQSGQSATGICPLCQPHLTVSPAGGSERLRCTTCGNTFDAPGNSPAPECPSCGVIGNRVTMRNVTVNPPRQFPERPTSLSNPFRPVVVKDE